MINNIKTIVYHRTLYAMLRLCYNQKFRDNPKTSCSVIQPNDIKTSNKNFLECSFYLAIHIYIAKKY